VLRIGKPACIYERIIANLVITGQYTSDTSKDLLPNFIIMIPNIGVEEAMEWTIACIQVGAIERLPDSPRIYADEAPANVLASLDQGECRLAAFINLQICPECLLDKALQARHGILQHWVDQGVRDTQVHVPMRALRRAHQVSPVVVVPELKLCTKPTNIIVYGCVVSARSSCDRRTMAACTNSAFS